MHIALVRTEFIAARGGAERYAVNLASRWAQQGHRISVVCHKYDEQDARGLEVVRVSRPKLLGPLKHRWFAVRAGKAASACGADAVLCLARAYPGHVLRLGDGLHRAWLDERYPQGRALASLNPRHAQLLRLEAELFKPGRFQRYVANSQMIRELVMRFYAVPHEQIRVIPNGVDFSRFGPRVRVRRDEVRRQLEIAAETPLVLFAGMDVRRKGLAEVAHGFVEVCRGALARPAARRPMLLCVGKGDTQAAQNPLREAGFAGQARFLPPSDDMPGLYAAADLFVLPTMHDPSANAVTEALACGLPVITSAQNGARQHIVDGINGYVLADRRDAREFASRVLDLLDLRRDPEEVAAAANLISLERNADLLLDVLKQAAQTGARP